MATRKQKQELIEALKLEKKKFEILLNGYGGEIALGRITEKQYNYWISRDDLAEYAHDWDNELGVPDEMQIFSPGSWYECDDLEHANGCEFSDMCTVVVYDDQGNEVWSSPLSVEALESRGVGVDGMNRDEFYVEDTDTDFYFFGQNFEKGTFQTYEVEIFGKFDPSRINFSIIDVNGWALINGVSYESIELDDTGGYSTTGKSDNYEVIKVER
jgi:hypothetical protein